MRNKIDEQNMNHVRLINKLGRKSKIPARYAAKVRSTLYDTKQAPTIESDQKEIQALPVDKNIQQVWISNDARLTAESNKRN